MSADMVAGKNLWKPCSFEVGSFRTVPSGPLDFMGGGTGAVWETYELWHPPVVVFDFTPWLTGFEGASGTAPAPGTPSTTFFQGPKCQNSRELGVLYSWVSILGFTRHYC